ncbi:hypothetical protein PMAYCL1PPCAC_25924 [Pristionchus mayeri]|uniref:Uncharacterized protein n=1 Tax=Pristionchus mayeri TaxID=1317129 RepID=A0AAN5D3J0_9BILA|nr:hypothetical protein PMAYCL1PPCAC_25924 [Pristionchus mayeri]
MENQDIEKSFLREELSKKKRDLESFRIYMTRLENELENSKEMLRSSRDENEDLLTSLIALNERIDKLSTVNQQLEYEKDLASGLNGKQDSNETLEKLQLRAMKAEPSDGSKDVS